MTVSSVTAATAPTPASSVAATNLVDYNGFLKLLIAQAQNQDPTNPTDSTQYLSQLASFSAVEQQTQTNTKLDALLSSSRVAQADSLIGHAIASADGKVTGLVSAVTITSDGLTATLTDGTTLPIVDGVTIG